jgi:hypothetical protein
LVFPIVPIEVPCFEESQKSPFFLSKGGGKPL